MFIPDPLPSERDQRRTVPSRCEYGSSERPRRNADDRRIIHDFQVRSHLRVAEGEVQTLRTNSCHLQDEMEMTQEYVSQLQRNLSSVLQEYRHLHDTLIPGLRYNQNQHQGALQVIERQRQQQRSKRSKLEEQYRNFLKGNVLIPRTSDLLMDCAAADQDLAMLCPFCPPRWRIYELSCYLQSEEAQNWEESLSWCRERGGFLAVVNDEEEQNFLEGFVNVTAWIGLSDHHREGNWRWVDGTPYESTTWVWGPEQPNNDGDEDCVTLSPASQWSDEECSEKYTSVCERRADQLSLKGVILSN
ncbi:CD209 antigen-like protein 2 [Leptodactylus fuscus]|uniref:CD209 antigen-like protein 2 n=1 Tax=Leptodactylus fuscus TaxID=238119 RepID=UPI003F4EDFCA